MIHIHRSLPQPPSIVSKPLSADVCLFNGMDRQQREHLHVGHSNHPRLKAVEWNQVCDYPRVTCWLNSPGAAIQRLPPPCDFIFMPDFQHSIISSEVAGHFGLTRVPMYGLQYPIPFMQHLGRYANASIPIAWSAKADIMFRDQRLIEPVPSCHEMDFLVSESVPSTFALFSRKVLNYLVIVFQGSRIEELISDSRPSQAGTFYFGANARSYY